MLYQRIDKEENKYQHDDFVNIDIISKDDSGIRDIRVHTSPDGYEFEKITSDSTVFFIPIFRWRN